MAAEAAVRRCHQTLPPALLPETRSLIGAGKVKAPAARQGPSASRALPVPRCCTATQRRGRPRSSSGDLFLQGNSAGPQPHAAGGERHVPACRAAPPGTTAPGTPRGPPCRGAVSRLPLVAGGWGVVVSMRGV